MPEPARIITPETHPDHPVVRRYFVGPHGRSIVGHSRGYGVYYCGSYDPRRGYWMTRTDCPPEHVDDEGTEWRRNVSERAIGRTYHRIIDDRPSGGNVRSSFGSVDPDLLVIPGRVAADAPRKTPGARPG